MSLRSFVLLVGLAGLAAAAWSIGRAPESAPSLEDGRRPNVLLVSIDSLRADHLHAYGYPRETSPAIDALARDGALFRVVVAPSSWTLPSHMTLLTALPPELHGVTTNERRLEPRALTLAEVLRDAGYATAGFVAAPYVRAMYGFDQGFDVYDESIVAEGLFDSLLGVTSPESTRLVTRYLEEWNTAGRKKPFFVFLHLWDVHYDYQPPPPYDTMFDPDYDGPITGKDFLFDPNIRKGMPERDYAHVLALYDGEIRFVDEHIGRIVDHLRTLGVLDETVVVVTSDHGEEFLEHGRKGHGETLYDEVLLVPLVIRFPPGVARGRVIAEQVRLMDVAPTILALAGVPRPEAFGTPPGTEHGALSLASALAPRSPADVPELVAFSTTTMAKATRSSTRRPDAKLIVHSPGPPRPELYDLKNDPREQSNLARGASPPSFLRSLEEQLAAWQSTWQEHDQLASALQVPPDQRERLRALGYVD